ncbi:HD domain-containing protein 2 [Drosophila mauritiana]|uniref:5'-deoxynucleotidase HDDC2 n=1 Tax=Drosophila mauritiana TaxID=7226 RepID=A0A6P8KVH8_DROMA|nr:HD domain-containing protein 2 [Drosophila mauritiana]
MFSLQLQQLLRATAIGVTSGATKTLCTATASATKHSSQAKFGDSSSHGSPSHTDGRSHGESESDLESAHGQNFTAHHLARRLLQQRSQDIQRHIHTQSAKGQTSAKSSQQQQQQQTATKFAMSSLAAEPLQSQKPDEITASAGGGDVEETPGLGASCHEVASASASAGKKPCFSSGLGEILQFMELIGNLKHTKRTGWVLRDVNDCESISGHMYRMSMLTFLLDGSEGLNQIRCMELALVHDLAESLVGDITPFCGISKDDKRAMEFKAMEDICKLIEPRGKRIMELFEEYEHGQTAESKFVKDLDRLDMVMQAFEYEKRDNCLLKHQEFFDSTEGKFNHPFVKKLVNEIYEQRDVLAKEKGATPPPAIEVPSMERSSKLANGHDGSS